VYESFGEQGHPGWKRRIGSGRPRDQQNGKEQRKTDWHRLTFWSGAAETVEKWVRKGTRMYVEGRIEYGSYDRDGVAIPTVDVVVQEFVFLDGRPNGDAVGSDLSLDESNLLD